jgi:hypothetical protein
MNTDLTATETPEFQQTHRPGALAFGAYKFAPQSIPLEPSSDYTGADDFP